jgi:hypothetical protein
MSRRGQGALGALLSVSFLSCLFALLLVTEQAFPPGPGAGSDLGLRGRIEAPLVVAGGSSGAGLAAPTAVVAAPVAVVVAPALAAAEETAGTIGSGTDAVRVERRDGRSPDRRTRDRADEREPRSPGPPGPGANEDPSPGHGGTPPGHGGTPPGQAKKAAAAGGSPSTPAGQGGTPPGQGGTPPGQAKAQGSSGGSPGHGGTPPGQSKNHGSKGQGKGHSKH